MPRIIYVLTNPSFDAIKIGRTRDLEKRMKALSGHSGVPTAYKCYYACEVDDEYEVEKKLIHIFRNSRAKKEFFEVDPSKVRDVLKLVELRDVTPSKGESKGTTKSSRVKHPTFKPQGAQKKPKRSPKGRTTFASLRIPVGSILRFYKDETTTCQVLDDRNVEFESVKYYLSTLAMKMLRERYNSIQVSANGFQYFKFENELLVNRRKRLENS